jgi:hypothetical protein
VVERAAGLRAGAFLAALEEVVLVVFAEVLRGRVPVLVVRDLVLLPLLPDVLVLRDPGGEDVRVAMLKTLGDRLTRHRD